MTEQNDPVNLKFQYSSVETLRHLFAAADAFYLLAPWRWMGDHEVVAVRDPKSERIAYCIVMGGQGLCFGLEAMLDDRGLSAFRETVSGEAEKEGFDFLHRKDSLAVFFENKNTLIPEDLVICEAAGVVYPPAQRWPKFRRFEPGFFPWLLEESDAAFMKICLEQVVEVARRAKLNHGILGPRDQRTFLARIPAQTEEGILWSEEFIAPEPLKRIIMIKPKVDQTLLKNVIGAAKKTEMIWEADCFWGPMSYGKSDERPRFPLCYMLADHDSGYLFPANLANKNDYGAGFLDQVCEAVKENGMSPKMIYIRQAHLAPVFAPLVDFGISTKVVEKLPMIDQARAEMFKAFGPDGVMHSGKGSSSKLTRKPKVSEASGEKKVAWPGKQAVYQFKVALKNIRPLIWRRFQVKSQITLKRLAATLLIVMGWDNCHLHQFHIGGQNYGMPCDDFDELDGFEDEGEFRLCDFDLDQLKMFVFEYDFGDGWDHEILFEEFLKPQKGAKYPVCLAGAHNCPPEDCGGSRGYERFLKAIRDPKHSEHASMVEWSGGAFNPEEFDAAFKNQELKYVAKVEDCFDAE